LPLASLAKLSLPARTRLFDDYIPSGSIGRTAELVWRVTRRNYYARDSHGTGSLFGLDGFEGANGSSMRGLIMVLWLLSQQPPTIEQQAKNLAYCLKTVKKLPLHCTVAEPGESPFPSDDQTQITTRINSRPATTLLCHWRCRGMAGNASVTVGVVFRVWELEAISVVRESGKRRSVR